MCVASGDLGGRGVLTRRKQGLTNFQHSLQYRLGRCPVICLMSSLNCLTPAVHEPRGQSGRCPACPGSSPHFL